MNDATSFLSRWAKRKAAAQQLNTTPLLETIPPEPEALAELHADEDTANPPKNTETLSAPESAPVPPALTDEDMPDIDTLNEQSDYSPFFSPEVTEELRKLALRKLFHSPKFHIRDGLDDYDGDFTQFMALGDTITADMKHQLAQEVERRLQQELDGVAEPLLNETPSESDTSPTADNTESETDISSANRSLDPQESKA